MYDGNTYTTLDVPGSSSTAAIGINNAGQIVGECVVGGTEIGFLATPVPEPGTLLLLGAELGGLVAVRARLARPK
jgi:hypothetical protein